MDLAVSQEAEQAHDEIPVGCEGSQSPEHGPCGVGQLQVNLASFLGGLASTLRVLASILALLATLVLISRVPARPN